MGPTGLGHSMLRSYHIAILFLDSSALDQSRRKCIVRCTDEFVESPSSPVYESPTAAIDEVLS